MIEKTMEEIEEQINIMKVDILMAEKQLDELLDQELTPESQFFNCQKMSKPISHFTHKKAHIKINV